MIIGYSFFDVRPIMAYDGQMRISLMIANPTTLWRSSIRYP